MAPRPAISLITAVFDPPLPLLRACIASVRRQSRDDWEWCIVDDGSRDPAVRSLLREAAARDPRIRVHERAENGGIVAASNDSLALAAGEWVAFLDHDDRLARNAFAEVLRVAEDVADADVIYTDEQIVDERGRVVLRFEKPGWSPTRMRSQMYTGHLCAMRADLVRATGGFRPGFDGSQDYDLVLRVSERARRVVHIPRVLYSWTQTRGSTANDASAKPWAYDAGIRAVQEHCDRSGLAATVEATATPGVHRLRWRLDAAPLVSIVIPTRGSRGCVWGRERCFVTDAVRSIVERTTYPSYEIVVVADAETPDAVLADIEATAGERLVLVPFDEPFNYSRKCNLGVASSAGEYLLFLNDDMEVDSPDWIEALLGPLQERGVGMTGALLVFPDGLVQHAGQCFMGEAQHVLYRYPGRLPGPMSALLVERECGGVTAACALMRRADFDAVGGFSEDFASNYNDVDLCFRVRTELGLRIVWTPHARLWHLESASRDPTVTQAELALIHERWDEQLSVDPYYAPPIGDVLSWNPATWR